MRSLYPTGRNCSLRRSEFVEINWKTLNVTTASVPLPRDACHTPARLFRVLKCCRHTCPKEQMHWYKCGLLQRSSIYIIVQDIVYAPKSRHSSRWWNSCETIRLRNTEYKIKHLPALASASNISYASSTIRPAMVHKLPSPGMTISVVGKSGKS